MVYTQINDKYFVTPKDDVKDFISVEIGDTKQVDFQPQVKIMRWDNEVNFSLRLVHEELTPQVATITSTEGEKILWLGEKIEAYFYEVDNGTEFEVILKQPPKTNVIEFTLNTKGLDFFYQPELTQEEI